MGILGMKSEGMKNLLRVIGSIGLSLAVGESVARALLPVPLQWLWPQTLYENSSSQGFRLKRNQSAYTADKPFQTNSMGLRGPERTWKKPLATIRILVLGD